MDQRKARSWLYIALFAVVVLIGIWTVIDLARDKQAPEASPSPSAVSTPGAGATPETSSEATPQETLFPSAIPTDRAPAMDFSLTNLNGDTVALADTRGKVTVVNFWGAWCGWCMEEMPEFAEMVGEYEGQDVAFLFVNYGDDEATAREAMEGFGVPLDQVLMDSGQTAVDLYEVSGFPTTCIIDKRGGVAETFVGYSTKDEVMPVIDSLLAE